MSSKNKKLTLTDASGAELAKAAPEVVDASPVGMQILVELLKPQEVIGTSLYVDDETKVGAPQGYILKVGPKVDDQWGLEKGQRVVLSGRFTPLPEVEKNRENDRPIACVEPGAIKAVLHEG